MIITILTLNSAKSKSTLLSKHKITNTITLKRSSTLYQTLQNLSNKKLKMLDKKSMGDLSELLSGVVLTESESEEPSSLND